MVTKGQQEAGEGLLCVFAFDISSAVPLYYHSNGSIPFEIQIARRLPRQFEYARD